MKKAFLLLLVLLALLSSAHGVRAAYQGPPGDDTDISYNDAGQWNGYGIGQGLTVTTTGGKKYLNSIGSSPVPSNAIIEENGTPILTQSGQYIIEE